MLFLYLFSELFGHFYVQYIETKENDHLFDLNMNTTTYSSTLGIIVAMEKELELVKKISEDSYPVYKNHICFHICKYGNLTLALTSSGIGKVNAAVTTMTMIEHFNPAMIISSGVCGGLMRTGMKQGDLVIGSKLRYHDVWCGEPNKPGQIQGSLEVYRSVYGMLMRMSSVNDGSTKLADDFQDAYSSEVKKVTDNESRVHYGTIVSGDWFVDNMEKARQISSDFPEAVALDMESAAIAQVCYKMEQPSSYIRIVSDVPLSDDETQRNYENFWETAPNLLNAALKTFIDNYFVRN